MELYYQYWIAFIAVCHSLSK